MKRELNKNCTKCVNRKNEICEGRYDEIEDDGLPPFEHFTTSPYCGFGDDDCLSKLVSVNSDGCVCINYEYAYKLRPLASMTKKEFAEFIVHLSEKDWFTMEIARCVIKRMFELKKWNNKKLTLNIATILH